MITSEFILNILHLALDDDTTESFQNQIPFLTIKEFIHTGIGFYIYFDNNSQVKQQPIISNMPLTGVGIKNDKENILADVIVYITEGLISCIEIFNKNGENYPTAELTSYEMYRTWGNENKRKHIIMPAVLS
jgi:hypothetical protein